MISLLRFACNRDLGTKTLVACSINDNFCTAKFYQKVQIMLAVLFFLRKVGENYARSDKLCQKLFGGGS